MASRNAQTVTKFYEIFMSGDPSTLPTVLDSNLKLEMMKGWPFGGTYSGLDSAMQDFFPRVWNLLKPFTLETHEYIDAGDQIIVLGTYHTPHKETGQDVTSDFAHIWTVANGKITRLRQFADTVQVSRALNHDVPQR